jgi:cytochrome c-type biogenesis protein CcsB
LKSNWLIAHVITCFVGYAAFAVAFGTSIMYLFKANTAGASRGLAGLLPVAAALEELTQQLVMFGFLFLSIGIITGAVWANSAWGRYWGWDPKETWSLVTWFVYATMLHARLMRGWQGRRIAYLSIIGFCAVLFTYFGVNLLPGLHSYGSMGQ